MKMFICIARIRRRLILDIQYPIHIISSGAQFILVIVCMCK